MDDFDNQVRRVMREIETDVVFKVNFKNCPLFVIEDVVGVLEPERARMIVEEVRKRLKEAVRRDAVYQMQILELHREHEEKTLRDLQHTFARVKEL